MSGPAAGRLGRPRHFEDETERRLLLDAALRSIRRKGYAKASVADVLVEAGLSTRAFYRHFQTKSDLFLAVFLRDAETVSRRMAVAVGEADTPVAAIEVWLDAYLALFYEPKRFARVTALRSVDAQSVPGYGAAAAQAEEMLLRPLVDALRAGEADGSVVSASPERDARTILAVAASATDPAGPGRLPDREGARAHVVRFCWPALGLRDPTPRRGGRPAPRR